MLADAIPGIAFQVLGQVAWARRPESRIGPLMVATGIAWFAGTLAVTTMSSSPSWPMRSRATTTPSSHGWCSPTRPVGSGWPAKATVGAFFAVLAARTVFRLVAYRPNNAYDFSDPAAADRFVADVRLRELGEAVFQVVIAAVAIAVLALVVRRLVLSGRGPRIAALPAPSSSVAWCSLLELWSRSPRCYVRGDAGCAAPPRGTSGTALDEWLGLAGADRVRRRSCPGTGWLEVGSPISSSSPTARPSCQALRDALAARPRRSVPGGADRRARGDGFVDAHRSARRPSLRRSSRPRVDPARVRPDERWPSWCTTPPSRRSPTSSAPSPPRPGSRARERATRRGGPRQLPGRPRVARADRRGWGRRATPSRARSPRRGTTAVGHARSGTPGCARSRPTAPTRRLNATKLEPIDASAGARARRSARAPARGLHPTVRSEAGPPAPRSTRLPIVPRRTGRRRRHAGRRFAPAVEATAYFVVAEALTNIAKIRRRDDRIRARSRARRNSCGPRSPTTVAAARVSRPRLRTARPRRPGCGRRAADSRWQARPVRARPSGRRSRARSARRRRGPVREALGSALEGAGLDVVGHAGRRRGAARTRRSASRRTWRSSTSGCHRAGRPKAWMRPSRSASMHPAVGLLILSQDVETRHVLQLLRDSPESVGYLLKDRVSEPRRIRRRDQARRSWRIRRRPERRRDPPGAGSRAAARSTSSTPRERDVLQLMAEGRSNAAIAERLTLTEKTVEGHVRVILSKLGLEPAAEDHRRVLAVLAYLRGAG